MSSTQPIGMFDSGVGGISVLREAVRLMPGERFIFFGDTKNAPYGTKTREEVLNLSRNVKNAAGQGLQGHPHRLQHRHQRRRRHPAGGIRRFAHHRHGAGAQARVPAA